MHTPQRAAYLLGHTDWPKAGHLWPITIALVAYLLGVVVVRILSINAPAKANAYRKISELEQASTAVAGEPDNAVAARGRAADLTARAKRLMNELHVGARWSSLSRVISVQRLLHAADEELVETMSSTRVAAEYASRVQKGTAKDVEVQKAQVLLKMREEHTRWDNEHETAASVHRRAMFLLTGSTVLLMLLAAAGVSQTMMVLAAAAGLVGAALRIGREKVVVTDYGLRWSSLLLAPVVSALCATLGLLLVAGMWVGGLVGETFAPVCTDAGWTVAQCAPNDVSDDPVDAGPLGLSPVGALMVVGFGFSERYFQRWIQRSIDSFDPDRKQPQADPAGADSAEK